MNSSSSGANYGGKQPTPTTYIKQFVSSVPGYANWVYKNKNQKLLRYITPATEDNVVLEKDLTVKGSIHTISDNAVKENIKDLNPGFCNNLFSINPKEYNLIADSNKKTHYGILAQDLETYFPELVSTNHLSNKTVNYIELIPIIIAKMKEMQGEIDRLKQLKL